MERTEDLFDRYLNGEMSITEKTNFERNLEADPDLHMAFDRHRAAVTTIRVGNMRSALQAAAAKRKRGRVMNIYRTVAVAAGVALVMGFFFMREYRPHTTDWNEIYANIYFKDPGLPNTMGAAVDNSWPLLMVAYKKGEYKTVLEGLDSMEASGRHSDTVTYYRAMCLLEKGDDGEARELLSHLSDEGYRQRALWYLALLDIKDQRIDAARSRLQEISGDTTHPFRRDANAALGIMEHATH